LLLRFNDAHWDFMQHVKDGTQVSDQTLAKFHNLILDFPRLDFDPAASDLGIAYTLSDIDLVFPYYDYGQLLVRWLVHRRTPSLTGVEAPVDPRNAVLAAVHGFIGWGEVLRAPAGDVAAAKTALRAFRTSLSIFEDNLPVKKLAFRCLATAFTTAGGTHFAADLLDAFVVLASKYPAVLATDIGAALAAAEQLGEWKTLQYLVEEWACFTGPITFVGRNHVHDRIAQMLAVIRHQRFFPSSLKDRIALWRSGSVDASSLPQRDRDLLTALAHDQWRQRLHRHRASVA